jgi:hypothetical protein
MGISFPATRTTEGGRLLDLVAPGDASLRRLKARKDLPSLFSI